MFRTKRLNDPPPVPYCVQYGPRGGHRSATNENTLVDFSFLQRRECPPPSKEWDPSPDVIEEMLAIIKDDDQ